MEDRKDSVSNAHADDSAEGGSAMSLDDSLLDDDAGVPLTIPNSVAFSGTSDHQDPIETDKDQQSPPEWTRAQIDVHGSTENAEHDADASESLDEANEDDFYEPPDTVDDDAAHFEPAETPPFSPAPPEDSTLDPEPPIVLDEGTEVPSKDASSTERQGTDSHNIALPKQVRQPSYSKNSPMQLPMFSKQVKPQISHFTPYESPLRQFSAYRFHPDYTSNVAGGYRSTTYSHNIDPTKPVCIYEGSGGICNDPTCDSQHFRQMDLSGAL